MLKIYLNNYISIYLILKIETVITHNVERLKQLIMIFLIYDVLLQHHGVHSVLNTLPEINNIALIKHQINYNIISDWLANMHVWLNKCFQNVHIVNITMQF